MLDVPIIKQNLQADLNHSTSPSFSTLKFSTSVLYFFLISRIPTEFFFKSSPLLQFQNLIDLDLIFFMDWMLVSSPPQIHMLKF